MRPLTAILFVLAAIAGACSVANPSHCANQDGHATCAERDPAAPYCNRCVAADDGCVAEPVEDGICDAGSTSLADTSTSDPTTSTTAPATPGSTSPDDPSTSDQTTTTSTSTGPDPTTTSSTTTGPDTSTDTSTTTGPDSDSDPSTTTGTSTTSDTDSTTDTTTATTEADTFDTLPIPICGDDVAEGFETCDGTDLNGLTCAQKNPTKYGGGILECHFTCLAYVEDNCCLVNGEACGLGGSGQVCCPGLNCVLLGGSLFGCQ
jgi:hypothetical protein